MPLRAQPTQSVLNSFITEGIRAGLSPVTPPPTGEFKTKAGQKVNDAASDVGTLTKKALQKTAIATTVGAKWLFQGLNIANWGLVGGFMVYESFKFFGSIIAMQVPFDSAIYGVPHLLLGLGFHAVLLASINATLRLFVGGAHTAAEFLREKFNQIPESQVDTKTSTPNYQSTWTMGIPQAATAETQPDPYLTEEQKFIENADNLKTLRPYQIAILNLAALSDTSSEDLQKSMNKLIPLLILFLGVTSLAQQQELDYNFGGSCASTGSWTQRALQQTQQIKSVINQLRGYNECAGLGNFIDQKVNEGTQSLNNQKNDDVTQRLENIPNRESAMAMFADNWGPNTRTNILQG